MYRFATLPFLGTASEEISELSAKAARGELPFSVTSLFFYHKEGHYVHEVTPLMFELDLAQFSGFLAALEQVPDNSMKS